MRPEVRRVLIVGYHAAELLDIASVTTAMVLANVAAGRPVYRYTLATPGGAPITCASGLTLTADASLEEAHGPWDTLIVSGGIGHEDAAADRGLVAQVRRLAVQSRRIASVCTGAEVLAAAGLLDGRRAATHWDAANRMAARYPRVKFDATPIFIRDGNAATSAGVTASLDLTLAFIEEDLGAPIAREVARQMVVYLQRPGNQAQMSVFTSAPPIRHDVVRRVVDYIGDHLDRDLSGSRLAAHAGISERQLSRLVTRELGTTLGRLVRKTRIEAAAQLLVTTDLSVESIAGRYGYRSAETLRQAFVAHLCVSPAHFRATQSTTSARI